MKRLEVLDERPRLRLRREILLRRPHAHARLRGEDRDTPVRQGPRLDGRARRQHGSPQRARGVDVLPRQREVVGARRRVRDAQRDPPAERHQVRREYRRGHLRPRVYHAV